MLLNARLQGSSGLGQRLRCSRASHWQLVLVSSTMPSRNRVALVLVDGIGDVSLPSLGYKTPLEVISTVQHSR